MDFVESHQEDARIAPPLTTTDGRSRGTEFNVQMAVTEALLRTDRLAADGGDAVGHAPALAVFPGVESRSIEQEHRVRGDRCGRR